jgi:iron-sulfur cluster assembly protein
MIREPNPVVNLTVDAITKLKTAVEPGDYIRVGVVTGGCSGYRYSLAIEEGKDEEDIILDFDGLLVCVDKESSELLSETEINYAETIMTQGFEFNNKTAERTCGCGESFSPTDCTK